MAIEPAAISAKPAVTTTRVALALADIAAESPPPSAKGTVKRSAMPITTSRTVSDARKCFSTWGAWWECATTVSCCCGILSLSYARLNRASVGQSTTSVLTKNAAASLRATAQACTASGKRLKCRASERIVRVYENMPKKSVSSASAGVRKIDGQTPKQFRCGFAAIIGRPNVGKSTLLNRLVGQKVSIVTSKPQTTRNRIQGIVNQPGGQLILIDTPGLHRASTILGRQMLSEIEQAMEGGGCLVPTLGA